MLADAIRDFSKQFAFEPQIKNAAKLMRAKRFVVCGMGGSNHPTDILKAWKPTVDVVTHRDYDLPSVADPQDRLVIACSYSGNTEESIDSFAVALRSGYPLAVIAKGGTLLERAQAEGVPYIKIPETDIQPRSASGFMFVALLKLMGNETGLQEARQLAMMLHPEKLEAAGKALGQKLVGSVPVVYASTRNFALANNWKIKVNENTKVPIFANVFPELNHNEMNGFDPQAGTRSLSRSFHFVFLRDDEDDPRIVRRMEVLEQLYRERELPVESIALTGASRLEKIFSSLLTADWVSLALAEAYGVNPEPVPLVEEFKKLIA